MVFIFGGCHQGKLAFAKARFALTDAQIQVCDEYTEAIDPSRRCAAYVERWALNRVRAGVEPAEAFPWDAMKDDAVVIATDVSCGVVPIDAELRAWREACGRLNARLAGRADEVWRLFCGIPQRLK